MTQTSDFTPASARVLRRLRGSAIVSLDAPHMPPPGPDFLRVAALSDDPDALLDELYLRALREPLLQMAVELKRGVYKPAEFVPGHIWGELFQEYQEAKAAGLQPPPVTGPAPADVMVIGKMPWQDEIADGRNYVGPTGVEFLRLVKEARIKGYSKWYVTNLVKLMPPDGSTNLRKSWVKDCLPVLAAELRLVRPKFILCLGADASRGLLDPKSKLGLVEKGVTQFGVGAMDGRVVNFRYCADVNVDEQGETWLDAKVMTVVHPVMVARDESVGRQLLRGLQRFKLLIEGADFTAAEEGLDHRVCASLEEAESLLEEAERYLRDSGSRLVAWDAEWHGQHPMNEGAYLRTVQMSWKPKSAVCFTLRRAGGDKVFVDSRGRCAIDRLMHLLTKFSRDKRAVGHFLVADMEWFVHNGFDLRESFAVPMETSSDGEPAWRRCQLGEGGFDTAMAAHAIEETSMLGLESLTMRYTTAPRYDAGLEEWKTSFCKERSIKKAALEGYGDAPDDVLLPYALYDADVTLRIAMALLPLLDCDYYKQNAWEAFWESMIIQPVILEIHQTGILVDMDRLDELTDKFVDARCRLAADIRDATNWHAGRFGVQFNVRSVQHVKEYLFGERLNGKVDEQGNPVRIRPKRGVSLGVRPLLTTDKPPLRWEDVEAEEKESEHSPSTAKGVLALLAQDNPEHADAINRIRDYRFLDQVLKSVLRPPSVSADGLFVLEDDNGDRIYEAGLAHCVDDDGRVRPHMYPTAETGRWKCSRPNLQNMCLDRDHEVLTRRGWVRFPDLLDSDEVAQFWPENEEIDFVVPSQVTRQRYKGDLIRLSTQDQIEIVATPNHRCLTRSSKFETGGWLDSSPAHVEEDRLYYHAGRYAGGSMRLSPAWVTFLCAVQADGSYPKQGGGIVFVFKKQRKIDRLLEALREVCPVHTQHPRRVGGDELTYIYVPAGTDAHQEAVRLMPDKKFGPWLLGCDRATLDLFCEEVFLWDGLSTRKTQFASSDVENVNWVQIIWSLSGWRARLRLHRPGAGARRDNWEVSTTSPSRRVAYSMTTNCKKESVSYDDIVYCVTVPSGYFVVRYNGKVSVTGNSKARDPDYERLLGKNADGSLVYEHKLRSMLCSPSAVAHKLRLALTSTPRSERRPVAKRYQPVLNFDDHTLRQLVADPEGTPVPGEDEVFIDFDFKGAELYGMAIMSGDQVMLDHARRNIMFDDEGYDASGRETPGGKFPHPDWFDIHSNVAVLAFRLTVPDGAITDAKAAAKLGVPVGTSFAEALGRKAGEALPASKLALGLIGKAHLRIVAKSVVFGVAYGRAAKAIALAVREQKVNISVDEAQQVIDALFALYKGLRPFFDGCRERALGERWLCSCYGRFRRFPDASGDFKTAGEFERQAMNFPIQSAIASALDRGVAELLKVRNALWKADGVCPFRFALTVHDAVLLQAKAAYVAPLVTGGLIKRAMCDAHPIYPADLDGMPLPGGPYQLGLDFEVSEYWSEPISSARCLELGVPAEFGK